jgi:hypothetical protein
VAKSTLSRSNSKPPTTASTANAPPITASTANAPPTTPSPAPSTTPPPVHDNTPPNPQPNSSPDRLTHRQGIGPFGTTPVCPVKARDVSVIFTPTERESHPESCKYADSWVFDL